VSDDHPRDLSETIWSGHHFTSIHAAAVVASLENVGLLSSTLTPYEYDRLMDRFQRCVLDIVTELKKQQMPVQEVGVTGGQAYLYFYDPEEVERNYILDSPPQLEGRERTRIVTASRRSNQVIAINAVKAAIQLLNAWLVVDLNLERVRGHLEPWQLGAGVHTGRVYLRRRPDGEKRIEGYSLNIAASAAAASNQGRFSHIMATHAVRDMVLKSVVKHTQMRQRLFFHRHELPAGMPPAVARSLVLFELKFYHRIGIHVSPEVIEQYEAVFALDRANLWAYYQLVDYYAYTAHRWNRVFDLAKKAQLAHPYDEKVLLDLAKYYMHIDKLGQSEEFALEALRINGSFDLVHEHLAVIANLRDDTKTQIKHFRSAVKLSPGSPVNNFNLGIALLLDGQQDEGYHFVQEAVRLYPDYKDWQVFRETLRELYKDGKLPELLQEYISDGGEKPLENEPEEA